MKLQWSKDKRSVILIAQTFAEVAFCDIFVADLTASRYVTTTLRGKVVGAKYSIVPDEGKKRCL